MGKSHERKESDQDGRIQDAQKAQYTVEVLMIKIKANHFVDNSICINCKTQVSEGNSANTPVMTIFHNTYCCGLAVVFQSSHLPNTVVHIFFSLKSSFCAFGTFDPDIDFVFLQFYGFSL